MMDGYVSWRNEPTTAAQAEPAQARQLALLQAALDRSATGLLGLDADRNVVMCNEAAASMLGVRAISASSPATLASLLQGSAILGPAGSAEIEAALTTPMPSPSVQVSTPSGQTLQLTISGQGEAQLVVVIESRATASLLAERTDSLTGLSDRAWLHTRLAELLAGAEGPEQVAVLMIDLDRFKAVNDSHGHPVGDALLQIVAKRLRSAMREDDVVSRLGGDEFAVAMPVAAGSEATASRLVELLSRPYLIDGQVILIGASIGVALGYRDGEDAASLLRAADLALYQAKEDGRQAVRVFTRAMDDRARARTDLLVDLRRAAALQQFELHFQPQTKLETGKLVGFEALIRWRHPELGLISPDRFIPMAEDTGLIIPIGEWVLRAACREAASWPADLTVAVNVSPRQLTEPDRLLRAVKSALALGALSPRRLEIEITESSLMGSEKRTLEVLHAIRALGVRVSMDDFGTGYSSLSQLRSFPFDKLKIDRSFLTDLIGNTESIAVIRAIAALGASLGMTTTAEGVETAEQAAIIRADGCTDMQGYLVSRPVPAVEVVALIERLAAELPQEKE